MTQLDPIHFDPFDPTETSEEPLGASTLIGFEQGQWVVYLNVEYRDKVRRHRFQAYRTERKARIAADMLLRTTLRGYPVQN